MIKEKVSKISFDKFSFYALLDKLNNKNVPVTLSYDTGYDDLPCISIENVKLDTEIDTSSDFNYIDFKANVIGDIDFPKKYNEYEISYLYKYEYDEEKIKSLTESDKINMRFERLNSHEIPEQYRKIKKAIEISIKNDMCSFVLKLDCCWDVFDEIINNIDFYRNEILDNIAKFKSHELEDSKRQSDEFWDSIDNMLENI